MRHPNLTFRCLSRSERDIYHSITVENGQVMCSCTGTDWCSHIDATLIEGEREMVPFEEWDTADQAQEIIRGRVHAPAHWKAHWREDRIWRGLAVPRKTLMERAINEGRPTICFIGQGSLGTRQDYIEEASDLGWQVVESPSSLVTLVVADPRRRNTRRAVLAIDMDLPIISFSDWEEAAYDFTETVLDAIERLRPTSPDQLEAA